MAIYTEDSFIKYDLNTHRYFITPEYFMASYGENLSTLSAFREDANPSAAAQRFLKRLSMVLYNYIYEYGGSYPRNKEILEYIIAKDHKDTLKEALGEFAYSFYLSGNDFSLETGLSLDNGREMTMSELMTQLIPPSVKMILENSGLLFRGRHIGYDIKNIRSLKEQKEF